MRAALVLAAALVAPRGAAAVDVVLDGRQVAPPPPALACAERDGLRAGTALGARETTPERPTLAFSTPAELAARRTPARGRVESLAYPRITVPRDEVYAFVAPAPPPAHAPNPCGWAGAR